jgi:vacuolar protein sorting-associated protein 16
LTAARDFEALETFSRSKHSPIGYTPFVKHLIERGHPKEALAYVPRCDANRRVDLYVDCGDWRAAGQECKTQNDKAKIECVPPVIMCHCVVDQLYSF